MHSHYAVKEFHALHFKLYFFLLLQAMWLVLQHEKPEDFVIGTGEVHSVREFTEKAFQHVGISIVYVQSKQSLIRAQMLNIHIRAFYTRKINKMHLSLDAS